MNLNQPSWKSSDGGPLKSSVEMVKRALRHSEIREPNSSQHSVKTLKISQIPLSKDIESVVQKQNVKDKSTPGGLPLRRRRN